METTDCMVINASLFTNDVSGLSFVSWKTRSCANQRSLASRLELHSLMLSVYSAPRNAILLLLFALFALVVRHHFEGIWLIFRTE